MRVLSPKMGFLHRAQPFKNNLGKTELTSAVAARASAAWFTFCNGNTLNINKTQVLKVHWGSSVANEWLITLRFDPFN